MLLTKGTATAFAATITFFPIGSQDLTRRKPGATFKASPEPIALMCDLRAEQAACEAPQASESEFRTAEGATNRGVEA